MVFIPAKHHHHSARIITNRDLRVRIFVTLFCAVFLSSLNSLFVSISFFVIGVVVSPLARLGYRSMLRRLMPFNVCMLLALLLVPWQSEGKTLITLGTLNYNIGGVMLILRMAMTGNAILLILLTLLGNTEIVDIGHAFSQLGMPKKLVHLLFFTVRYLCVFEREWERMSIAAKIRGFRPRMSWHSYKTYAQMIGILFVRSLERSERVLTAMRCRGFNGNYHSSVSSTTKGSDFLFMIGIVMVAALFWLVDYYAQAA